MLRRDAGITEQGVEPAALRPDRIQHRLDLMARPYIRLVEGTLTTGLRKQREGLFGCRPLAEVMHPHPIPGMGEGQTERTTDSAGPTGHQYRPAFTNILSCGRECGHHGVRL